MFEALFDPGEKDIIKMLLDILAMHNSGNLAPNTLVAMKHERLDTGEVVTVLAVRGIKQDQPGAVCYLPLCEIIMNPDNFVPAPKSEAVREWLRERLGPHYESDNLGFIPFSSN